MEDSNADIDKFIEEEVIKDIDQSDSIDESVDTRLGEMGWFWSTSIDKLKEDSICFSCKKILDFDKDEPHVLLATKSEKGSVAFVSVCKDCVKDLEEEQKKQEKGEKNDG